MKPRYNVGDRVIHLDGPKKGEKAIIVEVDDNDKMRSLGRIENHKCHMISSDVWATKSDVNDKNVCVGSVNFQNKKL